MSKEKKLIRFNSDGTVVFSKVWGYDVKEPGVIIKGRIVQNGGLSPDKGYVEIQGPTIASVSFDGEPQLGSGRTVYDFGSAYICPGFIDLHVHGAGGSDFMDGNFEALERISRTLAQGGTTSFLATTMSASREHLVGVIENAGDYWCKQLVGARMIGIHLEGPFLNPSRRGAQKDEHIRCPDMGEVQEYLKAGNGLIKMMTIAPELPGALEVIKYLKSQGIIVSLGHSEAAYEQIVEACAAGLQHVTHTFNAMAGLHHRDVGTAGAVLCLNQLTADFIPDGIHVHPEIIKILIKAKGFNNVIAVTDCIRAGQMEDGTYELGGQKVTVKKGISVLENGTISGSVISMNQAVERLVHQVGIPLNESVKMASKNPADLLGLHNKGCLDKGMDADITVLDKDFNVLMTMLEGRVIFRDDSRQ